MVIEDSSRKRLDVPWDGFTRDFSDHGVIVQYPDNHTARIFAPNIVIDSETKVNLEVERIVEAESFSLVRRYEGGGLRNLLYKGVYIPLPDRVVLLDDFEFDQRGSTEFERQMEAAGYEAEVRPSTMVSIDPARAKYELFAIRVPGPNSSFLDLVKQASGFRARVAVLAATRIGDTAIEAGLAGAQMCFPDSLDYNPLISWISDKGAMRTWYNRLKNPRPTLIDSAQQTL